MHRFISLRGFLLLSFSGDEDDDDDDDLDGPTGKRAADDDDDDEEVSRFCPHTHDRDQCNKMERLSLKVRG